MACLFAQLCLTSFSNKFLKMAASTKEASFFCARDQPPCQESATPGPELLPPTLAAGAPTLVTKALLPKPVPALRIKQPPPVLGPAPRPAPETVPLPRFAGLATAPGPAPTPTNTEMHEEPPVPEVAKSAMPAAPGPAAAAAAAAASQALDFALAD